jgi:hypothetical protein
MIADDEDKRMPDTAHPKENPPDDPPDDPLAGATLALLAERPPGTSVTPEEVARAFAAARAKPGDPPAAGPASRPGRAPRHPAQRQAGRPEPSGQGRDPPHLAGQGDLKEIGFHHRGTETQMKTKGFVF